jgi:hypothetical protein
MWETYEEATGTTQPLRYIRTDFNLENTVLSPSFAQVYKQITHMRDFQLRNGKLLKIQTRAVLKTIGSSQ